MSNVTRNTQGKVVGKKTLQYGGGAFALYKVGQGIGKIEKETKVFSKGAEKAGEKIYKVGQSIGKTTGKVKEFGSNLANAARSGLRNASIPTPSPEKQKVIDTINQGTKKGVKGSKKITLTKSEASNIKLQQSKTGQQFLKNIEGGKKYMDSVRNPKLLSSPKQSAIDTVNRGTLKGKVGQGKITLTKSEAGMIKVNQSGLSQNILKNAVKGVDVKGKTLNMVKGGGVPTSNRLPASTKKTKYRDTIKTPKDRKIAGAISKGEKKIARIQSMNVGKNNPNLNKLSNKVLNETKKEVRKIEAKSDFRKSVAKVGKNVGKVIKGSNTASALATLFTPTVVAMKQVGPKKNKKGKSTFTWRKGSI